MATHLVGGINTSVHGALLFSRSGLIDGELWRLWSGHLVHFSLSHLVWNLAAWAVAARSIEIQLGSTRAAGLILLLACGISAGILILNKYMGFYGGLSAINYGLFAWLSLSVLKTVSVYSWQVRVGYPVVVLLCAHSLYQGVTDSSLLAGGRTSDVSIAWIAHLLGVMLALGIYQINRFCDKPVER